MRPWTWLLLACLGCTAIDTNTRVERGPLLRTFERPAVLEGGVTAEVRADWPYLQLTVAGYDVCRLETVEEHAEEVVTERTARAFGPSLSTGVVGTLAGAGLLIASFFISDAPDTRLIDAAGHYGASTRQYVQLAGGISAGVGLPALVVGLVTMARAKDELRAEKVQEVVGLKDARCNERPLTGSLALVTDEGGHVELPVNDGALDVDGAQMPVVPVALRFDGHTVELQEADQARFTAWTSCVALRFQQDAPLALRAELLHACEALRGEAVREELAQVEQALMARRATAEAWAPQTQVSSFEDAVTAYAPGLQLSSGSRDLRVLDAPEEYEGRAVLLQGIVVGGIAENIGVVQVGDREVLVFIPPARTWRESFSPGTRVDAVALLAGRQTLGEKTLPLLRAVWMRSAW